MRSRSVALAVTLGLIGVTGFTTTDTSPPVGLAACGVGELGSVAVDLLGPAAEVVSADTDSALVLTPGVYPGVRNRLVATEGGAWCAASAVNLTAAAEGVDDAVALATRAATTLPAAHFDDVTVTDAREIAPGIVSLSTHARTNGVVADWTIEVDALGIRTATWTATDFAVAPFEAQVEGLTALPGAERTYERTANGLLEPTETIAEIAARNDEDDPSPFMVVETEDEFTVHIHVGDAAFASGIANTVGRTNLPRVYNGVAPDPGTDTGVTEADFLRIMKEGVEVNHADFLAWGLEKGWVDQEGAVYVDGALSAYCLACVLVSEYYNVHMSHAIAPALGALGYTYPDERDALIDIVGHEIVHNYQNAYGKPSTGGGRHNSFSEGTARFSETLHSYSDVSHQPGSLLYADDTNGCNGWQGNNADTSFAAGPLTGQSYDACYFWLTYYAQHGIDGFVGLFENSKGLESGTPWKIYDDAIAKGSGAALTDTLANFAAMSLTGRGYVWNAPADPSSETLDWARHLDRWTTPRTISFGDTAAKTLRDGGMAAYLLKSAGTVTVSEGADQAIVLVTDDGATTSYRMLADGDTVSTPTEGTAWIVLINASTVNAEVSVTLR